MFNDHRHGHHHRYHYYDVRVPHQHPHGYHYLSVWVTCVVTTVTTAATVAVAYGSPTTAPTLECAVFLYIVMPCLPSWDMGSQSPVSLSGEMVSLAGVN